MAKGWKRSISISIPIQKKGNAKECLAAAAAAKLLQSCLTLYDPIDGSPPGSPIPGILQARTLEWVAISFSNYCTIALILNVSKVMLKILQARLQQYMNHELPDVHTGFRKDRRTRDQIANICWIIKKAREFQKNINFCFIDYTKAFDCVDCNKLWKILKEMGMPDHLTCLLRYLYAYFLRNLDILDREICPVRTGHGTTDWLQIGKGVHQGCISSSCLFIIYAEYIMSNAALHEAQTEIKIAKRNINNLRYADDTPLW